jgi:hypothetical protein
MRGAKQRAGRSAVGNTSHTRHGKPSRRYLAGLHRLALMRDWWHHRATFGEIAKKENGCSVATAWRWRLS